MALIRDLLRAARQSGPEALNAVRQQFRGGAVKQAEDALRTLGITLQQQGNALGSRILRQIDPELQGVVDVTRRSEAARAVNQFAERQAAQRAARAGSPAPRPQWNRPTASAQTPPAPEPQWGRAFPSERPAPVPQFGPRSNLPTFEEARAAAPRITGPSLPPVSPRGSTVYQPNLPNPRGAQGRSFDALGYQEPLGPLGRNLLEKDPETYKSISNLAVDASNYYGRSITSEDLLGPAGTKILNALADRKSATPLVPEALRLLPPGRETPYSGAALPNIDIIANAVNDAFAGAAPSIVRNAAGGVRQLDLGKLFLQGAGVGAGGLAISAAANALFNKGENAPSDQLIPPELLYPDQGNTPLSETPEGVPVAGGISPRFAPVQGNQDLIPARPMSPPPGQIGAGSVVIRTNDSASNRRQALANAAARAGVFQPRPEEYTRPRDFYRAAAAYGRQPGVAENLQEQFAASSPRMGQADMQAWIAQHPDLAYQLSLRNSPRDVSQQSLNVQGAEITTELGSNNSNNAVGNTAEAVRVAGGSPADLKQATDPRLGVSLQAMPRDLQAFFNRFGFAGTNKLY